MLETFLKNLKSKTEGVHHFQMVFLQDQPVHETQLIERLSLLLNARPDDSVFLKGDREVPYGQVMRVLDILHEGGIVNVGMVTEKPSNR